MLAISIDDIFDRHPVNSFYKYWRGIPLNANGKKDWQAFNPMGVHKILPWVMLLDQCSDGSFIHKICGTGCESLFGLNIEGDKLGDVMINTQTQSDIQAELERVLKSGEPSFSRMNVPIENKEYHEIYRGVFGFQSTKNGVVVEKAIVVIGLVDFDNEIVVSRRSRALKRY